MRFRTVFLSSTARDLQAYRDAVTEAISRMDSYHCVRMEDFGAVDSLADDFCRAKVAECDVFMGLVGHLYGSCPPGHSVSYTEREYQAAVEAGKPRLLFLASEAFPLSASLLRDAAAGLDRQETLRERVRSERIVELFDHPDKLATLVVAALQKQEKEERRGKGRRPPARRQAGPDLAEAGRRYLQHLADRYRYLDFRGMGVRDSIPLRLELLGMYVPSQARVELPEGETPARQLRVAGRQVTEEEAAAMGQRLSGPRPVLELLREESTSGLVLLGDPGAGKTTFLKYLALAYATGQGEALGLGERLPVLLPLSAYANALDAKEVSLGSFAAAYYRERIDLPLADLLKQALAKGRALLLLDGLDEVRERRLTVVDRVREFYDDHRRAGNKFVLTSRIVGYREVRPAADGLVEATLVDFDDEEIEQFVGKWTASLEKAAAGGSTEVAAFEAHREREELLAAVRHNPGVRSLAANPLLLTILALMKRQGVALPERRVQLYQTYVETLLKHWNLARGLAGRPGRELDVVETVKVLAPLALWMHETSPGVGLVKERALWDELEKIFRERKHEDPERAARQFLEDVREHSALLLDRGGKQYGFIHLTFQEYLAAVALGQRGQQDVAPVVEELAAHLGEPTWREVSLLAVGYLGIVQQRDQAAGSVLQALIEKQPGPPGEAVVLAGRALADVGQGGVPPGCRQKVVDALVEMLGAWPRVPARTRAEAGWALAAVGDPRPEVMTVDGMELCWVPPGPFLMGSLPEEEGAYDDEKPQSEVDLPYGYWIGRYPVTVAQLREAVEAGGLKLERERVLSKPLNSPANNVSWREALTFCEWLSKRWRSLVTLPSEAEWEKAARGGLGLPRRPVVGKLGTPPGGKATLRNPNPDRRFPWGDKEEPERANYEEIPGPSTMGCFPGGRSPYGCEDLSGNVWEWTRSLWGKDWPYPYQPNDGRENLKAGSQVLRALRGGSFFYGPSRVRCAARGRGVPDGRRDYIGFRVVCRPHSPLASEPLDQGGGGRAGGESRGGFSPLWSTAGASCFPSGSCCRLPPSLAGNRKEVREENAELYSPGGPPDRSGRSRATQRAFQPAAPTEASNFCRGLVLKEISLHEHRVE